MTKPEVGASADSWGTKLNTDLDSLDAAIIADLGMLSGLTLSAAGSTATFGVAAGAAGAANGYPMVLASAYTKTASSWAVGSGNGSLDTGAVANSTWYHVWLIRRPDTGVVDVLTSLSATAPTLPTNYTQKRRIGSMKTNGSAQWVKFLQDGDTFTWDAIATDVAGVDPGTSGTLYALSVPLGVRVSAMVRLGVVMAVNSSTGFAVCDPNITAPAATNVSQIILPGTSVSQGVWAGEVLTNTSQQVRAVVSVAGQQTYIFTLGWRDRRGRG